MKNRTGLVALVVLAVAALLMVFFVLPNIDRKKPAETPATATEAAAEGGGETKTADGKQARPTQTGDAAATEPAAGTTTGETSPETATETAKTEAAPADTAAGWVVPAFDLLRIEPDGSTVIAGRAQPNTKVEIRNGETVIATVDVGPSGDFAAVLDQPLAAGDYQLTLNASDGKGASNASQEVATVSVPKDGTGELLAMVSKPGEASRLITVPEAAGEAATAGKSVDGPAGEAASEPAATASEATTAAAGTQTAATAEDAAATAASDTAAASDATAKAQVRVAAVELEGDRMFIAGNARPGALVRIYADDRLVGEMKADEEGRYVVDGRIDLPVGRHTIRADVMSADGGKVELRASVPFDRPEGEQVAVVAQDDSASAQAMPALGLVGGGTFDKLRGEAAKALSLLRGLYANGRLPTAEELAAARSATEIALRSLAEFKPGAEEGGVARDMAAKASAAAADALARLQALPKDVASVGAALGSIETAVAAALAPAIEGADVAAQAVESPAEEASSGTVAAGGADAAQAVTDDAAATPPAGSQQAVAGEPETVEQAPLQASKTSVIIRRGDTLWQISRRIYGKGVRYTTIYLANQDQINDPDRIIPGQVFGVPDEATESDADAEAQHRKHMRGD